METMVRFSVFDFGLWHYARARFATPLWSAVVIGIFAASCVLSMPESMISALGRLLISTLVVFQLRLLDDWIDRRADAQYSTNRSLHTVESRRFAGWMLGLLILSGFLLGRTEVFEYVCVLFFVAVIYSAERVWLGTFYRKIAIQLKYPLMVLCLVPSADARPLTAAVTFGTISAVATVYEFKTDRLLQKSSWKVQWSISALCTFLAGSLAYLSYHYGVDPS
jgi:hypothetical protein